MPEEAIGDLEGMMELSGLARLATQNGHAVERGLAVRFALEPMQNEQKTKEMGRPIFDDVEVCEIRISGSTDTVREVVSAKHRERFPSQYIAFKRNQDQDAASGTPLSAWPLLSRAQAEEARYFGVRTVEQLAEMPEGNVQRLGIGWQTLRQQARDWLKKANDGALLAKMRAELDERDRRIDTLEKMLNKQAAELQESGVAPAPRLSIVPAEDPRIAALEAKINGLLASVPEQSIGGISAATGKPKRKYVRKAKPEAEE